MIGKLTGMIDHRASDHVLIDVGGVGYIVYCSDHTLGQMPASGEACTLYTELLVREDIMQLFGFATMIEKEWHRLLMGVQGVGAKASLAILGALGPDGLGRAISLGDWNTLKSAKGIGPKSAQRIVLDLKDKLPNMMAMGGGGALPAQQPGIAQHRQVGTAPGGNYGEQTAQAAALSALGNLGYAPAEAASAVAQAVDADPGAGTSALIRAGLKLLAPKV